MRLAVLLMSFFAAEANACGYCVEDKIAAVYDHAALAQAQARKQTTVYFAIDGTLRGTRRQLEKVVQSTPGVEKGSARLSVESAALAVTFDPRRASLAKVQRELEEKLRPLGLQLLLLDTKGP